MENTVNSASTTARATASLTSTRSLLERLNAQRAALLAHEATVLVHSSAVQNLADYPDATTINFSSNHPTSLTMERVLRADGSVHQDATDEVVFEITKGLQETAIIELARASKTGTFTAGGIHAVATGADEVVTGTIDLLTAAGQFPELPDELQSAALRPLAEGEQTALVSAAHWTKEQKEELLGFTYADETVEAQSEVDRIGGVLMHRGDGEHPEGMRILDAVSCAIPTDVANRVHSVQLHRRNGALVPVLLLDTEGQIIDNCGPWVKQMVEEAHLPERLAGLGEEVPVVQLERSGITVTGTGWTVHFI